MRSLFVFFIAILSMAPPAVSDPTLEDYASLPRIRSAALSDSGNRLAAITIVDGNELLCVFELDVVNTDCFINVTDLKPNRVMFAGNDRLILVTSKTAMTFGYRGRFEYSAAFSVDLKTKKIKQLMRNISSLHPAQAGLGRVLGVSDDGDTVYMPAFVGRDADADYNLFRVKTDSLTGKQIERGASYTIDWFIAPDGTILAREDMNNRKNLHEIDSFVTGKSVEIYSEETEIPHISVLGLTQERDKLVVVDGMEGSAYDALYTMDLRSGELSKPMFHRDDREIDAVLIDKNRIAYGVRYSGMTPTYDFFDKALAADIENTIKGFDTISVSIDSWSADWSRILLYISGGNYSGHYVLYDRTTGGYKTIATTRAAITPEFMGELSIVDYQTRDGLNISAIVTWPVGIPEENRKNLPVIMMPHGGPETSDQIGFDWMAQYFASRGYAVIQPNFRGSSGFGSHFTAAGRGEWGKAMQNDLTDALTAIKAMGWVDPDRACIVGWSYGGYAALAGGALTPDTYKCVVSIAGVSDLPRMLIDERRDHGQDHWVYSYWSNQIGDVSEARDELKAVSPAYHADAFKAPVLLIHGKSDLTVPFYQSTRMEDALKDAGKDVTLILMEDQDHSLSTQNARVEAMKEIIAFVDANIGAAAQ